MIVVLDTNVLVSAFVFQGLSADVYDHCQMFHELMISERIIEEFHHALEQKLGVPRAEARRAVQLLRESAVRHELSGPEPGVCRDPDDNHVFQLAALCRADLIISGDRDLLVLGNWQGIPIVTPRRFLEKWRNK